MFEAEGVGYFAYAEGGGGEDFFGFVDQLLVDMLLRAESGEGAEHIAQVIGCHVQAVCKICNGGEALGEGFFFVEIFIEQLFELLKELIVDCFSGNELTLVKSLGVGEEQLYLCDEYVLAKIVYPLVELSFDDFENGKDGSFFLFGHM